MKITEDAFNRAKKIKLIIFDVDGTLTDSKIYVGANGEFFKVFHCQDGLGIKLAQNFGIQTAILTGRESVYTSNRAKDLGITAVKQGHMDKRNAYKELKAEFNLRDDEIAYVADDLIDLPVFVQVGFRAAVANARIEVKERANFVAENDGGNGAVREVIEFILKAQGKWADIVKHYTAVETAEKFLVNQ